MNEVPWLASRVLRAARDRVPDVWASAAGGLSEDELVREWPFVRGQMRALAARTIRAPGSKSPAWAGAAGSNGKVIGVGVGSGGGVCVIIIINLSMII